MSSVRDIVQSSVLIPLVGDKCAVLLVDSVAALDPAVLRTDCFTLLLSKTLGIAIVVGASIVKVPQIVKIASSRSAAGVSLISYVLETLSILFSLGYNVWKANPFSTYGESAFILAQNAIILLLLTVFSKKYVSLIGIATLFSAFSYLLFFSSHLPADVFISLQWASIVISTASKLPQIHANYSAGTTGQLSAITVALQFLGTAVRIFTTLREVKDQIVLVSYLISTVLNGILFAQVLLLGGKKTKKAAKKKSGTTSVSNGDSLAQPAVAKDTAGKKGKKGKKQA
ncbi:hypothetical protein HDU83_007644 [Entophlyctis luteolus]|nr:hypothetical protein HDU82_009182 [Entophlyctis luteolus]KAJ3339455.1 hypothetical protein HDU83_007644 [Entophlyctis luteolus]KAJ3378019.1 hypothetical protein HDU84_008022 [Entophlyctis sp. JEL0112]